MNYEKNSLMECRKIKADLEETCRTCDRRCTNRCLNCYNIILRRDVELRIRRIEGSREYELSRDMVRYIYNTSVDCDTCTLDCDGLHPCPVNQKANNLVRRYLDLYGELVSF